MVWNRTPPKLREVKEGGIIEADGTIPEEAPADGGDVTVPEESKDDSLADVSRT